MHDPFDQSEITSILVVKDPLRSKSFYIDQLGAKLHSEYGTSVVLKFLGHWMLLVEAGAPTADKPQTHLTPPQDIDHLSHCYTIRVKDCQKSYNTLVSRGVKFITPPHDWGYELRCFFRDFDGHLFEISEFKG